jgi:amino acid transporter
MGTEFKIEDLSYSGSAYTFRAGSALLPTTRLSSIRSYISALEYQTASGLSAIFFVGLFLPGNSGLQGTGITTDPKEFVRRLISVVISRPSRVCLRLDAVVLLHHRVCALCPRLWKLFLGIFIAYGLKRIFQIPSEAAASFKPFLPNGAGGVVIAMGLTFIAFEGYDLIATVAEEIKASEKTIPRATLISLAVTVFIYLMILLVCIGAIQPESGKSWEFLGQYQETAIARAAQRFMPFFGVALIIFGGLLSTISALNATILASSRVAFSMSRDKMLPVSLSTIHAQRRTPHIAIAVTGAIVLVMALLFPIQVIGSAASVMFLLTFTLVNLSLIALRRKFPELKGGFRVPLYPATPIAAIALNMFLAVYQFNFDPRAWYIAMAWIIIGLFIYFMYFEKVTKSSSRKAGTPMRIASWFHCPIPTT